MFRRGAHFADEIPKGAKPADLPVECPTKFNFAINLKTARAFGPTIPPSLLIRADMVREGNWYPKRVAIIEFPSGEHVERF